MSKLGSPWLVPLIWAPAFVVVGFGDVEMDSELVVLPTVMIRSCVRFAAVVL
jgi:hypothetical protein